MCFDIETPSRRPAFSTALSLSHFSRVADNLNEFVPNLDSVILTGNNIQELCDLDPLTHLPKLETLSLLMNPIANLPNYREYVVYK